MNKNLPVKYIQEASKALVFPTTVYVLYGYLWVPHYTKSKIYVAPGNIEKPENELLALGATRRSETLWSRLVT